MMGRFGSPLQPMLSSPRPVTWALPPVVLIHVSALLSAAEGTWSNPGGGSWAAASNWVSAQPAQGLASVATFPPLSPARSVCITLDGARTIGGLVFAGGRDWSLRRGSGGILTLDASSGLPTIDVGGAEVRIGVNITGSDGFAKTGTGRLILEGANPFTGPVQVNAGALKLAAPPVFPAIWRVMPLGDSITYGWQGSHAGYRGPLHDLMISHAPGLRYAGSSAERPGLLPTSPVDQRWHEGHSSYNLDDLSANLDGLNTDRFLQYGGADRNPNGGHWLTGGNGTGRAPLFPHAILLLAGANDLDMPDGSMERLRGLVAKITTLRPDATLFVASITPINWHLGVLPYNAIVQAVVAEFQAMGKKVRHVDLHTGFPANGHIADGVHPNDIGFSWMAAQWHEALLRAHSPSGGITLALPSSSVVSVASNAVLELAGTTATTGSIACHGTLDLGAGAALTAPSLYLLAGSALTGSGSVDAAVVHNGSLTASGPLAFRSSFINNGSITPPRQASISFHGDVTNNGILTSAADGSLVFHGNVTNNGVIRMKSGSALRVTGSLVNLGVIDLLTGSPELPETMVNFGIVIDPGRMEIHEIQSAGGQVTVRIRSHAGHFYQLQRAPAPHGPWEAEGSPQLAATDGMLSFQTPALPPRGFLRIQVDP